MSRLLAQTTLNIGETAREQGLAGAQNYIAEKPSNSFSIFLTGILQSILVVAALLVLFGLILGAIEWISGGGDKAKIEKARNRITQSVIGLIVLSAVTAIFILIQSFLGVEIIKFNSIIRTGQGSDAGSVIRTGPALTTGTKK